MRLTALRPSSRRSQQSDTAEMNCLWIPSFRKQAERWKCLRPSSARQNQGRAAQARKSEAAGQHPLAGARIPIRCRTRRRLWTVVPRPQADPRSPLPSLPTEPVATSPATAGVGHLGAFGALAGCRPVAPACGRAPSMYSRVRWRLRADAAQLAPGLAVARTCSRVGLGGRVTYSRPVHKRTDRRLWKCKDRHTVTKELVTAGTRCV